MAEEHVWISISGKDDAADLPKRKTCRDILRLEFHDLDVELPGYPDVPLFSEEHAGQILDFFNKYRNEVPSLVVHCDAGRSRSPAVAAALTHIMGKQDKPILRQYNPNMRVYRMLLDEFYNRKAQTGE